MCVASWALEGHGPPVPWQPERPLGDEAEGGRGALGPPQAWEPVGTQPWVPGSRKCEPERKRNSVSMMLPDFFFKHNSFVWISLTFLSSK